MLRWRGLAALAAAAVLAAGVGQTGAGHAILRSAGLLSEPSGYTSLAFTDPQALPEQLAAKRTDVGISFVVRNSTPASHDYQWSVVLVAGQQTRRLAGGTVRVAPGRAAVIARSASISCSRGRVQMVVGLARPAESIDAWAACLSKELNRHEPTSRDRSGRHRGARVAHGKRHQ
jgi:hypothetical protein